VGRDAYVDDLLGGKHMSEDHNQHQKNDFNPDWDAMAALVEENQRLAKHLSELKDWEAVAADQALTIAMMKTEQAEEQNDICPRCGATVVNPYKQREWLGLTDDEIRSICNESYVMLGAYVVDFIKAIEAKLKDKNTSTPKLPPKSPPKQCTDLCGND
jgi:ribosomal protein S27AE